MSTATFPDRALRLTLDGRPLALVGRARVYLCGITPYDVTHLGHAATFVWADALTAALRLTGAEVSVCRNVTDIDDVLSAAAARRGQGADELAVTAEFLFDRDMAALRVPHPAYTPRAHRHVGDVIALADALLTADHAYELDGQVYFRGRTCAEAAGSPEPPHAHGESDAGAPAPNDPYDVAVWRRSAPGEPAWPSPWGPGRPGWHAECAAIAASVLGPSVDVLAGGADLTHPHHIYLAGMVEAATGVAPFARARFAVGTVLVDGAKMAKSADNLVLVSELLRSHRAPAVRLLLLDRDWRLSWDYTPRALAAAEDRLDRLYAAAGRSGGSSAVSERAAIDSLLTELDVARALNVAEDTGGATARFVLRTLSLA